jgi:alkylated DNA nucleotide flippase Atl1
MSKRSDLSKARIIELSEAVKGGQWTTYGTIGEVVYGPGRGAQTLGNVLRAEGLERSAHRTLQSGGKISPHWRGAGGGPDECRRRLRAEGVYLRVVRRLPAWLLFIYFEGDAFASGQSVTKGPVDESGWQAPIADAEKALGIDGDHLMSERCHKLFRRV